VGVSCPRLRSDFSIQINPTVLKAVLLRHLMQFEVGGWGFWKKFKSENPTPLFLKGGGGIFGPNVIYYLRGWGGTKL